MIPDNIRYYELACLEESMKNKICVVAILKDELRFVDEWLYYHKLLGIDHFFLYDDDPLFPLANNLKQHASYITVVNWYGQEVLYEGRNTQTKAYEHALIHYISEYEWAAFIDGDEFIVLPAWNDNIYTFLEEFEHATAISLNWHVFGHNGYFEDPEGLVTSSLIRRMGQPSSNIKSITRTESISKIDSAHFCRLKFGRRVDANHKRYNEIMYEGRTDRAFVNHYQCRSFTHWMSRLERGDVSFSNSVSSENKWRYDKKLLLKKFVEIIALDKNEHIDEYMLKFQGSLESLISSQNEVSSKQ